MAPKKTHNDHCSSICIGCLKRTKPAFTRNLVLKNGNNSLENSVSSRLYSKFFQEKEYLPKVICANCRNKLEDEKSEFEVLIDYKALSENVKEEQNKVQQTSNNGENCLCELCRLGSKRVNPNAKNKSNAFDSPFLLHRKTVSAASKRKLPKVADFLTQSKDQIDIKNELIDKHEELQIKVNPPKEYFKSDQGYSSSNSCNAVPSQKKNHLQSKNMQMKSDVPEMAVESAIFVKLEPNIKPEIGTSADLPDLPPSATSNKKTTKPLIQLKSELETVAESGVFVNVPNKKTEGKRETNSQNVIKTFLQTDQGLVLIEKGTSISATINENTMKPLLQLKTVPETVAQSEIFVKSEPYIKPEIFIGISESDLPQEMSTSSHDPLDIAVHEEKKHLEIPRKPNYKCFICSNDTCSIVFSKKFALEYHYSKFHEGKKTLEGKHTKMIETFPKSDVNKNISKFHRQGSRPKIIWVNKKIQCSTCFKVFLTEQNLNKHFSSVHAEKNFRCPFCFKNFSCKNELNIHLSEVHEKEELEKSKLLCPFCPTKFISKGKLDSHLSKVHDGKKLPVEKKNKKKRHSSDIHEKTMRYQCPFCPVTFGFRNGFDKHLTKFHEGKEVSSQDAYKNDMLNNSNAHQDMSEMILPD